MIGVSPYQFHTPFSSVTGYGGENIRELTEKYDQPRTDETIDSYLLLS